MKVEFTPYPKTPRLYRQVFITEKIDGSNAGINIVEGAFGYVGEEPTHEDHGYVVDLEPDLNNEPRFVTLFPQSRNRLITAKIDNFGFATWVRDNALALATILGTGMHFGEWWGSGIQRGYGLTNGVKRFSLFNVGRWDRYEGKTPLPKEAEEIGLCTVPLLYSGKFSTAAIDGALDLLRDSGSQVDTYQPFKPAEGVVIYHKDADQAFKVLLENDDISKTEAKKK